MGIIVSDTFTESSDTNLDSHTPDTGTGWTKEAGDTGRDLVVYAANDEVNANLQRDETLLYSSQPNPTTADVDVEFDSRLVAAASSFNAWGVFARFADTDNYYSAATLAALASADKRIHKRVAGVNTEIASGDNGTTSGDVFRFDVRDATKKLYQNDSEVLSTTDNDLTGAGKAGLASGEFMSSAGATDPLVSFDNYVLTEVSAGGNDGTSAVTLENASSSASGEILNDGVSALTLENAACSASGAVGSANDGASAVTLEAAASSASGEIAVSGNSAITLEDFANSAAGAVQVLGSSAVNLENAVQSGTGAILVSGSSAVTLDDSASSASGTITDAGANNGTSAVTLEASISSATGEVLLSGASAITMEDFISTALGQNAIDPPQEIHRFDSAILTKLRFDSRVESKFHFDSKITTKLRI